MWNIFSHRFALTSRKNAIWKWFSLPLRSEEKNLCAGEEEWIEYELWKIKMHFPFQIASDDLWMWGDGGGSIVALSACFIELSAIKIVSLLKRKTFLFRRMNFSVDWGICIIATTRNGAERDYENIQQHYQWIKQRRVVAFGLFVCWLTRIPFGSTWKVSVMKIPTFFDLLVPFFRLEFRIHQQCAPLKRIKWKWLGCRWNDVS